MANQFCFGHRQPERRAEARDRNYVVGRRERQSDFEHYMLKEIMDSEGERGPRRKPGRRAD